MNGTSDPTALSPSLPPQPVLCTPQKKSATPVFASGTCSRLSRCMEWIAPWALRIPKSAGSLLSAG
jgi:hypothetical protein